MVLRFNIFCVLIIFYASIGLAQSDNKTGELDLQSFINTAAGAGQKQIVVPPGVYRVKPSHGEHLVLRDLSDLEIIAENVEMICTETTRALTIVNCRNIKLTGLTIDYDPLPFTQGRIIRLAEDKSWIDFEIIEGYPENLEMRIEIFDSHTYLLKRDTYYGWQPFKALGNRCYRVKKEQGYHYRPGRDKEEVGDILVTNSSTAPGGSIAHAVVCDNNVNVTLSNISLYASNCFGFLENGCEGTVYRQCIIDRRALDEDIKPRGLKRLRSLDADAFHSKHAIIGPSLINCVAHFQGDDCVNICGDYHMVMASNGTKLRVLAKHDLNIVPGDPLEIVTYAGVRLPEGKAVSINKIGEISIDELTFLSRQRMNDYFKGGGSRQIYEVEIDRPIDLPMGSVICSTNRIGNGFKVIGCDFGYNRSRGILIKASNGIISGNKLSGCWEEAIKVSPEYWWLEAGSSNDLTIANNTISDCLGKGITVYSHAGNGEIARAGAHNNIVIKGNKISRTAGTDIWVTSTKGLVILDNELAGDNPEVKLERCIDVQIDMPTDFIDVVNDI